MMYQKLFLLASLVLASTAQAQTPDRTLMRHIALDYATAGYPNSATGLDHGALVRSAGDRALLGQVENAAYPGDRASSTDTPIDGSRALLGNRGTEKQSSFHAKVRGHLTSIASGKAEFGAVLNPDGSPAAFVVSLGVCGEQSAILFTRRSGIRLEVGHYRISEQADEENEILALVLTGSPTRPTGVFRGASGWLVVTAASEQLTAGEFEIDAIGFTAAQPEQEDQHVDVTGLFSATRDSSAVPVCENAK